MPDSFLKKVAAHYGTEKPPVVLEPVNGKHPQPDHPLVRTALEKRLAELSAMGVGSGRNAALNVAAAYLGRFPIDRGQLRAALLDACAANGVLEEDGQQACENTISSGLRKADADGPRVVQERAKSVVSNGEVKAKTDEAKPGRHIQWTRGSEISTAVPTWAWHYNGKGRIQLGTLSLLAGRPGAGKSSAARWFAAQASIGELDGQWENEPQHVAYIAAEESLKYTIVPGLRAGKANMDYIHFPAAYHDGERTQILSILDEAVLTEYILDNHITIVIVDPLMSTVTSRTDINRNNEVRAQIAPWARIAEAIEGITLGVVHLRKNSTNGDVVAAVNGSSAFGEVARAIFGFAKIPDSEDRVMSQHKNSTGSEDLALTYQIAGCELAADDGQTASVGVFNVIGESEITVEDILTEGIQMAGTGIECQHWLEDFLGFQGSVGVKEVEKEAQKAGSWGHSTLYRAAKKLRVVSTSAGFPRVAFWALPAPPAAQSSQVVPIEND